MPLKILKRLNDRYLAQIEGLRRECAALDKTEYSFYTGDKEGRDFFALYYDKKQLAGFAFCCADEPAEISGAVLPAFRRQHIFTSMANALKSRAKAKAYEFSGRDGYPGFAECAKTLGAAYRRKEHLMRFTAKKPPVCPARLQYSERENGAVFLFLFGEPERPSGYISLFYDGALVNIFNVYVGPKFRGQGLGYAMMCSVLDRLAAQKAENIVLHVSGNNKHALALYCKCGFEIIDSVVFYSSAATQDSYSP